MTIDIDDIEARITEAEAQSPAGFELLGIYLETEEARVLCAEVRELRDLLYSLLAVIHRDGGHYTGEHGVEKSARDAQQVVHADRAALERATLDHAVALSGQADNLLRAEAALVELGRRLRSKTLALQEAEESVDRLQASKAELQIEIKDLYAARPNLSEWAELTQARSKAEAALERARALASRWRDTLCLFPNLEALVDEIDALLAAAPGGAA